jgi:hypothetical protein
LLKRQAGDDVPTPEVKAATAVKGINMAEAFDAWKAGKPGAGL